MPGGDWCCFYRGWSSICIFHKVVIMHVENFQRFLFISLKKKLLQHIHCTSFGLKIWYLYYSESFNNACFSIIFIYFIKKTYHMQYTYMYMYIYSYLVKKNKKILLWTIQDLNLYNVLHDRFLIYTNTYTIVKVIWWA